MSGSVSQRQETDFISRRRQRDSAFQKAVKHVAVDACGVRVDRLCRGRRRGRTPRDPEDRTDPHHDRRNARSVQDTSETLFQVLAELIQTCPAVVALQVPERRQTRRHGHWISRQGAGLIDAAARCKVPHDFPGCAERAHRHASADHLAERSQIRLHAVERGGTARTQAEPGYDLVEDQQRSVARAELA